MPIPHHHQLVAAKKNQPCQKDGLGFWLIARSPISDPPQATKSQPCSVVDSARGPSSSSFASAAEEEKEKLVRCTTIQCTFSQNEL